jgi:hypothetical protein
MAQARSIKQRNVFILFLYLSYIFCSFGNGTAAGLLSPLQLESNRNSALGILANSVVHHHHHRTNGGGGRTSDLLSGIRRSNNVSYIKEEDPSEIGSGGYQVYFSCYKLFIILFCFY